MQERSRRVLWTIIVLGLAAIAVAGGAKIVLSHAKVKPVVTIIGASFSPQTLRVHRGTTVLFVNEDAAPHTITADDGSFASGILAPGQSFSVVVRRSVAYRSRIDPGMTGSLVVS